MPAEPPAAPAMGWRDHWPAAVLAVVAALVALWARHALFPAYSWNRDEPVYLWHVDVLRHGQLTATDGGFPELFRPWLSAQRDGTLFTQYTLGWPLVLLAAAVVTGTAGSALLLGAGLAVVGTYALAIELWGSRRTAVVAAGLLAASPILPIQGGVYLSYLFTLGLGLLFGVALLSGLRRRRRWRLVAAGALLGWVFLTRPYDAVLWGAAFATYAVVRDRHRWRSLVVPFVVCGLSAVPFVALALAYNRHVTGALLRFPITAADPLDTFGFGTKRLMPTFEAVDYGLGTALRGTAKNGFVLPWFLVGSYVGLAAALAGLWQRRRDVTSWVLVLVAGVFPAGYFVFWGNHLSSLAARISGPIYLIPLYAPICLLVASVLVRLWDERRRAAWVLVVGLVVGTVPAAVSRFDVNRDVSAAQGAWRSSVQDLDGPSLVFVADTGPYLLYLNPFSANGPELDDQVLYAAAGRPSMLDLIASMPERTPYLQRASVPSQEVGPREDPYPLQVVLTPIEVRRGATLDLEVRIVPPAHAEAVALRIQAGAVDDTRTYLLPTAPEGPVRVQVAAPGVVTDDAISLEQRGAIRLTVGFGGDPDAAAAAPAARLELQYRVADGRVELLLPATEQRYVPVGDSHQWRHAVGLPELAVTVR